MGLINASSIKSARAVHIHCTECDQVSSGWTPVIYNAEGAMGNYFGLQCPKCGAVERSTTSLYTYTLSPVGICTT